MDAFYQSIKTGIQIDYVSNTLGGKMGSIHYHDAYEIYILEKGERTYIIDDTFVELSDRDIALIKPYELHSTDGGIYSRYLLYFTEEYLDRFFTKEAKETLISFFSRKKLTMDEQNHEKLKALLAKLRNDRDDFILFGEIMRLFLSCCEKEENLEVSAKNRLISCIIEYLANNYSQVENLDKLADRFFITKHYLCRLFKKETGVSVVTYINNHKVQSACEMLEFTRKSIDSIAAECGFNSSMYFCKLFKKTMGMRPGEYRKLKQY